MDIKYRDAISEYEEEKNISFSVGDKLKYTYDEFDGSGTVSGTVTEVGKDYVLMTDKDSITYRFDKNDILSGIVDVMVEEKSVQAARLRKSKSR